MKKFVKNPEKVMSIIRYTFGLLGLIALSVTILTLTNVIESILITTGYKGVWNANNKLIWALTSAITAILFLFISFSRYIDKFFLYLEKTEVRKKRDDKGITLESIFFLFIAVLLISFAIMLAMELLTVRTDIFAFLGESTVTVLIVLLVLLSLLAVFTAFNSIIMSAIKELKKVTWPTLKQMLDYSVKVFSFIFFFSILFIALDELFRVVPQLVGNFLGL